MKSKFGSDTITVDGIDKISLTAQGQFTVGQTNDEWKVKAGEQQASFSRREYEQGDSKSASITLKDAFGAEKVDIRDLQKLELITQGDKDKWQFKGMGFSATCAGGDKKITLKKFENWNTWVGESYSEDIVFTGDIASTEWSYEGPVVGGTVPAQKDDF
ncbi:hypothetical protein QQS21_003394 [Conoideocrella luteorostrata]|uniref:Uncharacterized protein n=1 Tax=Conoideocrella luteorostrata TaxID=1105319 RepID=A0AAJ0CWF9_9HYPO|nr:hypothetical protein QQS21_003394 [Conoideocrella luteorostrata]